jgi:hypothetical protein
MTIAETLITTALQLRCVWCATTQPAAAMQPVNATSTASQCRDSEACYERSAAAMGNLGHDQAARWLPAPSATAYAMRLLDTTQDADVAVIPMVMPGKVPGRWATDQEVETVAGAVFLATDPDSPGSCLLPGFETARDLALALARAALGERPGMIGWATVERDGTVSATEEA